MLRKTTITVVILGLMASAAAVHAQEMDDGPRMQVSISPILALAEIINGEFEYAFSPEVSGVFGLGRFTISGIGDSNDITYLATDAKLRFYPSGTPLEGFNITGILGRTSLTESGTDEGGSVMALGVELGWSALFGDAQRWFLGAGIGAKRYFGDETVGSTDVDAFLPTGRLNFGIAF